VGRLIHGHSFGPSATKNDEQEDKRRDAMHRAVADLAHQPVSGPVGAPGRNFSPLMPQSRSRSTKMQIAVKSRAEEQFTATQKKAKQALTKSEIARQERVDHIAKLKALRLAKEAADKQAAEKADAEKAAAKKAATEKTKPSALPEVHRHQS
jgi:hypothetical protein